MIVNNLLIVFLLIIGVLIVFGKKLVFGGKTTTVLSFIIFGSYLVRILIEGYKLGHFSNTYIVVICSIIIGIGIYSYIRNNYFYMIHNVKQDDVITIIKNYLDKNNIKYETEVTKYEDTLEDGEIYLPDLNKTIYVSGFLSTNLNLRKIKNTEIINGLISEVKREVKKIKKRYFPLDGILYLLMTVLLVFVSYGLPNA